MINAKKSLNTQQLKSIEDCIREAETKTGAEIVCAVATESGRYDRAESIFGIFGAVIALSGSHLLARYMDNDGMWSVEADFSLLVQVILVVTGFLAGILVSSLSKSLRAYAVPKSEVNAEIHRSAQLILSDAILASPRSAGAVLLYISLAERRATILCDRLGKEALDQDTLDSICQSILQNIKQENITTGLTSGVAQLAEHLSSRIPAPQENLDELENHVLLFHPRP